MSSKLVQVISRAFCETIRMTFGVCVCVEGISPSITFKDQIKVTYLSSDCVS